MAVQQCALKSSLKRRKERSANVWTTPKLYFLPFQVQYFIGKLHYMLVIYSLLFSLISHFITSPRRSPGRAIVLPPASALASVSALAKSLTLKFFMRWARRCQASYPVPVIGLV